MITYFSKHRQTALLLLVHMGSRLKAETEVALAGVLRLCNDDNISVTQEDFDALERHDEAALASLDVNEEDAVEVGVLVQRWFCWR